MRMVVGEVEMSRDWFHSVFIVPRNISKVFAETTQSAARFATVYFSHKLQVKQLMRLGEMHVKWSVMVKVRLGPDILFALEINSELYHQEAFRQFFF